MKDIVESGGAPDYDPWAVQEVKQDPKYDFLDEKKPKREPNTLKQAPVSLAKSGKAIPAVRKPEGGKSYNPNFNDWQALVTREGDKEVEAEKARLQEAKEEAERMERAEVESDSEEEGNESAWESEWEGFSDDENKTKQKRPERKTPAERNKFKRKKAAEGRAKHDAHMKAKEQQLQRVKELQKSVIAKEKAREALRNMVLVEANDAPSEDEGVEVLRKKRFGKHL
jgi:nucleolar protein 53